MTPQEINEAVASKFGYSNFRIKQGLGSSYLVADKDGIGYPRKVPDYCTSIAAAWGIVEKCEGFRLYMKDGLWEAEIMVHLGNLDNINKWREQGYTAPMAICLAFLKLPIA